MGKTQQKSRKTAANSIAPAAAPPRPAARRGRKPAIPLTSAAEPLAASAPLLLAKPAASRSIALLRAVADGTQYVPDGEHPLPRSRSLAVPRQGLMAQFSRWVWSILPKKPRPSLVRAEAEVTRKQLKELRRQIAVMERTLGRLS